MIFLGNSNHLEGATTCVIAQHEHTNPWIVGLLHPHDDNRIGKHLKYPGAADLVSSR